MPSMNFADRFNLPGFRRWIFCPGMLFNASNKWWRDRGPRNRPHEGLDLLMFEDEAGEIRQVNKTTAVSTLREGVTVAVIPDFLGQTIIVESSAAADLPGKMLFMYAHTKPDKTAVVGATFQRGEIIAAVAGPGNSSLSPHLHLSVAVPLGAIDYGRLSWDTMGTSEYLTLLDPLFFLDTDYRIADGDFPGCRTL